MMHTNRLAWRAACVVLVAAAPALATEPVSLRPRWIPGDERRYDLRAEYRQSASDADGPATERRVTQSARLLLHVTETTAAGGASIRLTFDSLHVELAGPESPSGETFDWPLPKGDAPAADPTPLAALCAALAGCTMVAEVAPDGSVTGVTGLTPLAKALQTSGGDSPALMGVGFFSPVRLKANLASLWQVDPEGRGREPGARWQSRADLPLGKGFDATAITQWTLATGGDGPARIEGVVTLAPSPNKREADPAAPRLAIEAQSGSITVEWDTARGLLVSRTSELASTWTAEVDLGPGASVEHIAAESSATARIELKLVD